MKVLWDPKRNDAASIAEFFTNAKGAALLVQGDGNEEIVVPLTEAQRQTVIDALTWKHVKDLATA